MNISDGSYEGDVRPSGEKGVHSAAYQLRPEISFVIHTHQSYASALSILGHEFQTEEGESRDILGEVLPCAGYGMYATKRLINAVKKEIKNYPGSLCVLMKYHGALCMGKDYEQAFQVAYALERESRNIYKRLCGDDILPDEENLQVNYYLQAELDEGLRSLPGVGAVTNSTKPYTLAVSKMGKTMPPYLDDLAQIAGTEIKCLIPTAQLQEMTAAFRNNNAVFLQGLGALCIGCDEPEAEAVSMVLEKACLAAYLSYRLGGVKPLSKYHAAKDRKGYVNNYSKLK